MPPWRRQRRAIDGAAEATVYGTGGYWAERDQNLNDGDDFTHYLKQARGVVSHRGRSRGLSRAASAKQWPTCREYTHTQSETLRSVGQISIRERPSSTTATQRTPVLRGWGCGRALTLRNNVIIDINTCSADPADSALKLPTASPPR